MATHKYIHWRNQVPPDEEGRHFANVHLLERNQGSVLDFAKMAAKLRETFPQAKDEDIYGGRVTESSSVKGYTIIAWNWNISKGEYPEWCQDETRMPEYCW